jgi:hypothetical protein
VKSGKSLGSWKLVVMAEDAGLVLWFCGRDRREYDLRLDDAEMWGVPP